jgi:hypothetical protein
MRLAYDFQPSGLRAGSPPSPPPRLIRPTVWDDVKEPLKSAIYSFGARTSYLNSLIVPGKTGSEVLRKD